MFSATYHSSDPLKALPKAICSIFFLLSLFSLPMQVMANIAGKTILAKGEVNATNNTDEQKRKLKRRSKIFSVDTITTGLKSKAQFSMSDGGLITLKESTNIKISNYEFNQYENKGSATLEVVSGGLRSISGLIKKSGGDYQVNTPVGSIGIRGTHFAVQVTENDVFFGVFSGDIDIKLLNKEVLSLGENENYSFASVSPTGQVTLLTQAPVEISMPIEKSTSSKKENEKIGPLNENSIALAGGNTEISNLSGYLTTPDETTNYASLYNESNLQGMDNTPISELISQRTGSLSYQNVGEGVIHSSVGDVTGFNIGMTIDFDQASIPQGSISFSDQQGQWFSVFSGLINVDQLDLGINFASHGDNKATGDVSAAFSNGLEEIIGSFNLHEINQKDVNSGGSFKIVTE